MSEEGALGRLYENGEIVVRQGDEGHLLTLGQACTGECERSKHGDAHHDPTQDPVQVDHFASLQQEMVAGYG